MLLPFNPVIVKLSLFFFAGLSYAYFAPRILYIAVQSQGILTLQFDPSQNASSSITILDVNLQGGFRPGWLHLRGDKLYSISRTEFPNVNNTSGGLFSFSLGSTNPANHGLQLLNSVSSNGLGGVALDISRDGRTLSAADIDGSTVSIHPLWDNGTIGEATYVFHFNLTTPGPGGESQVQSDPHEAIFEPSGQFMFSPDRGADLLRVYRVKSPYDVSLYQTITLDPGSGPRHATFREFNSTRTYMYLVSELDNTVRIFTLDGLLNDISLQGNHEPCLQITLKQLISTIGQGTNRTAPTNVRLAAEVALSNDGRFAYVSNRDATTLTSDTIAIFSVHPDSDAENLVYLGFNSTNGKIPRDFSLSNDKENRYLAVGNQISNNEVILERDPESGFLTGVVGELSLGNLDLTTLLGPMAVVWA